METRVSEIEKQLALHQQGATNLQQNTNAAIQGMQSQLFEMDKKLDRVLPVLPYQEANEEEIQSLSAEVKTLSATVHEYVRKQMYFAGGLACLVVVVGIVLSIGGGAIMWFINSKVEDAKDERNSYERRLEKIDLEQRKQLDTQHKIELYLARGGDASRGTYSGDKK